MKKDFLNYFYILNTASVYYKWKSFCKYGAMGSAFLVHNL